MKRDRFVVVTVVCKECGHHIEKKRIPERIANTIDIQRICPRCSKKKETERKEPSQ